jgi:predicted Zn-dependent peptidase
MPIETFTFKNGFKLVYEKAHSALPITSILAFIKFGSIDESKWVQKGITHFIEHMCFKGTKQMDSAKDIMTTYDEIGAYLNAHTNKEYTSYVVKCNDEYTANCIDVLSDMVLNSVLDPKEIALERNVVKEETIRLDDNPDHHISKMTHRLLYGNSQYSYPIDDLDYHTCSDPLPLYEVKDMYMQFYQPNNMGLSIVSNLSFRTIKRMVESSFFSRRLRKVYRQDTQHVNFANPITTVIHTIYDIQYDIRSKKGVSATHLNIAFRTCEHGHKDMYPLNLLASIIGGYMSSRMFMLLREKHGVTYKSVCELTTYRPMGQFELYTMCDHTKMMRNSQNVGVLQLLLNLLRDLVKNGITQKELTEAKGNFKGKFTLSMENVQNQCEYNGHEIIIYNNNDCVAYKDIYKVHYENITKKEINNVIHKYLRRENMVVCLFGEHVPKVDLVKKYCHSFP